LDTVQKVHVPLQAGAGNAEATICFLCVSICFVLCVEIWGYRI